MKTSYCDFGPTCRQAAWADKLSLQFFKNDYHALPLVSNRIRLKIRIRLEIIVCQFQVEQPQEELGSCVEGMIWP